METILVWAEVYRADVAGSSPVVPAIHPKDFRIEWRPTVTIKSGSDKGLISPPLRCMRVFFFSPLTHV